MTVVDQRSLTNGTTASSRGATLDGNVKTNTIKFAFAFISVTMIVYWVVSLAFIVLQMHAHPILNSQTPALSPDGVYSVVIEQPSLRFVDRNFRVVLTRVATGEEVEIFRSKDQSPSITKENFVWSKDSRYFALIGDSYYVVDGSTIEGGDIIFLVYDVTGEIMYCNADDDRRYPRMSADSANAILRAVQND